MQPEILNEAIATIRQGGVIAYPTEGVYGLGCDANNQAALNKILAIKQRPMEKGMICLAADWQAFADWITKIPSERQKEIAASWPGAITWLCPATTKVPALVKGNSNKVAIRISAHPIAHALCQQSETLIVSTSANLTGHPPCRSAAEVSAQLGDKIDYLIDGPLGGRQTPTPIRDALSGEYLRS